jgi:hypothetical protein
VKAVEDDVAIVGQHSPELDPLPPILARHPLEVLDECILAVAHHRIVLSVGRAHVPPARFGRLTLVEQQVVERGDG